MADRLRGRPVGSAHGALSLQPPICPTLGPSPHAVQLIRGMDKTVEHLVGELKKLSKDVTDEELKDVATVSAGGNEKVRRDRILLAWIVFVSRSHV